MKANKRIVRRSVKPVGEWAKDLDPVLAQLLANREVVDSDALTTSLEYLHPFQQMTGIEQAVDLLQQALDNQWHIMIIGDFDADGATSTALAVRALRLMGAEKVTFLVPNRFEFGYGLTPEIVAVAMQQAPDLIVTVDNGISSIRGVDAAKRAGMRVLVTDHHLPAQQLPTADAIVNPNQNEDRFPSKALAGVGVIFYVMMALRARLRERGWFSAAAIDEPNLGQLLDLVALGTVADVVPLDRNNRILVSQGLARIRAGQVCEGIRALADVARRPLHRLVPGDLGYAIGPRLNAAGRMHDMSLGIRLLITDERQEALTLAQQMDELNRERRGTEEVMREQAMETLQNLHLDNRETLPWGVCLHDPEWHEGVIGILASRIKDHLHRPVIVFTDVQRGDVKGSARSIPGLHIRDALDAVAAHHPGLITKFGGHAMAAGLTLPAQNLETFRRAFDEEVRRVLSETDLEGVILSDGELAQEALSLELAETLRYAMPWGQGFPEPLFDGEFEVVFRRIVGERHLKLGLKHAGREHPFEAIWFNVDDAMLNRSFKQVEVAYRLDVNEFNGRKSLQLMVEHLHPLD